MHYRMVFIFFLFFVMNQIIPDPDEFADEAIIEVYEDQDKEE